MTYSTVPGPAYLGSPALSYCTYLTYPCPLLRMNNVHSTRPTRGWDMGMGRNPDTQSAFDTLPPLAAVRGSGLRCFENFCNVPISRSPGAREQQVICSIRAAGVPAAQNTEYMYMCKARHLLAASLPPLVLVRDRASGLLLPLPNSVPHKDGLIRPAARRSGLLPVGVGGLGQHRPRRRRGSWWVT